MFPGDGAGETTWQDATIAWVRPSELRDFSTADLASMGEAQCERLRSLSGSRARGFLAGRALIHDLVVRLGGGPAVLIDSVCPRCGRDHDAPRTPGFTLSVSHAADLVAVAVSRGERPLGVDIEHDSAASRVVELSALFTPRSAPALAGWTRIEAAIKADGRGITVAPADVRLYAEEQRGEPQQWSARLPDRAQPLRVSTLAGPVGYTLSVARG